LQQNLLHYLLPNLPHYLLLKMPLKKLRHLRLLMPQHLPQRTPPVLQLGLLLSLLFVSQLDYSLRDTEY
jgi:hypothetical protein